MRSQQHFLCLAALPFVRVFFYCNSARRIGLKQTAFAPCYNSPCPPTSAPTPKNMGHLTSIATALIASRAGVHSSLSFLINTASIVPMHVSRLYSPPPSRISTAAVKSFPSTTHTSTVTSLRDACR